MALFDRLSRVVKANLSSLTNSDDPRAIIDATIAELHNAKMAAHKDELRSRAAENQSRKSAAEARALATTWGERAALALRNGDEALAREALKEKLQVERTAAEAEQEADAHASAAKQLEVSGAQLAAQARDLDIRKGVLVAEVAMARAEGQGGFGAAQSLQNATDRVTALEAEVEANQALSNGRRSELEAKFAALSDQHGRNAVEDELAALKAKLDGPSGAQ